jgi:hypothetical protein
VTTQLDLFNEAKVSVREPEPMTEVKVGSRVARIPLRKRRREALARLIEILKELEGKDIYIGCYEAGGNHFRIDNLLLRRLQLEYYPYRPTGPGDFIPGVVVLWGNRSGQVRIFTNYLVAVREQEYMGYWHYLLDFRNGLWEHPVDNYRSHYACLTITRFKD